MILWIFQESLPLYGKVTEDNSVCWGNFGNSPAYNRESEYLISNFLHQPIEREAEMQKNPNYIFWTKTLFLEKKSEKFLLGLFIIIYLKIVKYCWQNFETCSNKEMKIIANS